MAIDQVENCHLLEFEFELTMDFLIDSRIPLIVWTMRESATVEMNLNQ